MVNFCAGFVRMPQFPAAERRQKKGRPKFRAAKSNQQGANRPSANCNRWSRRSSRTYNNCHSASSFRRIPRTWAHPLRPPETAAIPADSARSDESPPVNPLRWLHNPRRGISPPAIGKYNPESTSRRESADSPSSRSARSARARIYPPGTSAVRRTAGNSSPTWRSCPSDPKLSSLLSPS